MAAGNNLPSFKAPDLIGKKPAPLGEGDLWAGRARAIGQGLFSLGDEAEAALRAAAGEDYTTALNDIRQKYARYKEEEPIVSTGIELGTGLATAFTPAGWAGRAAQLAGRVPGVGRVLQAAAPVAARLAAAPAPVRIGAQGALSGAVSGFGAGEGGFGNRATTGLVGAGLGAGLGAVVPAVPAVGRYAADVARAATGRVAPEKALEQAQNIVSRAIERGGKTLPQVYTRALRDEALGSPAVMAQLDPELMALAETTALKPSAGRRELVEELVGQQAAAPERYKAAVQTAIPSPDYFNRLGQIQTGMRTRANSLYEKAYEHGDIQDPVILKLLDQPDMREAFKDAAVNSRRLAAAAEAEGEDASKFALKGVYEPRLDVQGNLVGMDRVGTAPDVRTLDFVKQALDRRISSLYASGQGGEATALKEMRNAMVKRLDQLAPDYRTARQAYAGDIEIEDALRLGREDFSKMRWQEVKKLWSGADALSPGEKEAVKTGYLQRLVEPAEDAGTNRNFAQRVIGSENERKKLKTIVSPKEYRVLESALKRQSELFSSRSQALGNSATARRAAGLEDLDRAIAGGDVKAVTDMVTGGPNALVRAGIAALNYAKNANMSEATYTQLARILRTKGPAEIAQALRELRDAAIARGARTEQRVATQKKVASGTAASMGPAPGEGSDVTTEEKPFVLRVPTFGEEPSMGVNVPVQ